MYTADGNLERRNARLVAKGYNQCPGADFNETFAPVFRLNSLRTIMALAGEYNMNIHELDIETAYVNGNLDEEIYMEAPEFLCEILEYIIVCLSKEFRTKDMGPTHYCLRIEFKDLKNKGKIVLSQRKYVEEILKKCGMENC